MKINLKPKKQDEVEKELIIMFAKERNKTIEQQKEIERLNNIIKELEKWLKGGDVIEFDLNFQVLAVKDILNKLQELKENKK